MGSRTISCLALLASAPLFAQLLGRSADIHAAAIDSKGFIYLAGEIIMPGLPTAPGVLQPGPPMDCSATIGVSTCRHGFVAKVAPSGDVLVWATYLGGDGREWVTALAVAPDGNIVVAGSTTSKTLLPALGGYRTTPASIFIAKLSSDGRSLLAGTYFGGDGADKVVAMKLDASGVVYVAGEANSVAFPTTAGVYQRARSTGPPPPGFGSADECSDGCSDQFLAKFDPSLKTLLFSTLIGTSARETTGDLALGQDGTLYIAGTRGNERGPGPAFPMLTRLTRDASSAIYSTIVALERGPIGGYSLAVDSSGHAYLGGDNRMWPGASPDGIVWKLDPQGRVVGRGAIRGLVSSLAAGSGGEIVVLGWTWTGQIPVTAGAPILCGLSTWSYNQTAYVARWNALTMSTTYAAYLETGRAWLVGPELVLAGAPYINFPEFALVPAGPPPAGTVTCMANSASYDGTVIAPGELVSVFGSRIGPNYPVSAQFDPDGNVTSSLGGISVWIGGLPAPLLYAAPDQINLVTPFGIAGTGRARVEIHRDGSVLSVFDKTVVQTHAALFWSDPSRPVYLAALNQDGSVNSAANMASPGTIVTVFATGLGAMIPQLIDGARPSQPIAKPVAPVAITVSQDAVLAQLEYVGNAPTLVQGAVQINFRLPQIIRRDPFGPVSFVSITLRTSWSGGRGAGAAAIFVR